MVALIPCVYNDYVLTVVYFVSGIILILAKNKQHDWLVYGVGFVVMKRSIVLLMKIDK